jgi:polyisoprenoid-binding protein YceI
MVDPIFAAAKLQPKQKGENMSRYLATICLIVFSLITWACVNPAANKQKASVANATQESNSSKPAEAETLAITPENSKVEFVAAKVTRSHLGSFKQFSGKIDLVASHLENSRVSIDIDADSVVTDEDQLTAHLKTPDFFDVAKYPKATFVSTKIEPNTAAAATRLVTGNFELHGIKKSISFPATIQVGSDSVSVNAEFSINRQDFGLVYPGKADDLIRDGVVIKLSLKVPRTKR